MEKRTENIRKKLEHYKDEMSIEEYNKYFSDFIIKAWIEKFGDKEDEFLVKAIEYIYINRDKKIFENTNLLKKVNK